MKLKKVGAICSADGCYYLMDQKDAFGEIACQWLGDGNAAYPLMGLPYMDLENICTMFDIPEKKQDKLIMRQEDANSHITWGDTDPTERQLEDSMLHLRYEGRELLPLRTSAGIVFIQEKYLAPLDDMEYMQLYERRAGDNGVYIVAKVGMVVQAVIMPMDVVSKDLIGRMEELTDLCRMVLTKKNFMRGERERAEVDRDQSTLFRVDESTGEITGEGAGE